MQLEIYLKKEKKAIVFKGDRIDVLDFERDGVKYKQIRYFRKGFSKSTYIEASDINRIKEIN